MLYEEEPHPRELRVLLEQVGVMTAPPGVGDVASRDNSRRSTPRFDRCAAAVGVVKLAQMGLLLWMGRAVGGPTWEN